MGDPWDETLARDKAASQVVAVAKLAGDPRFHALLAELGAMHGKKAADYGRDHDPFANVRASAEIGIPAWKGAWLRAKDKVKRIDTFCVRGTLANEGVEDSFLDLAAYSLICLILFRELIASKSTED